MPIQDEAFFVGKVQEITSAIMEKHSVGVGDADAMLAEKIKYDPKSIYNWRKGISAPSDVRGTLSALNRAIAELGLGKEDGPMEVKDRSAEQDHLMLFQIGQAIGDISARLKKVEEICEKLDSRDRAVAAIYKSS